MTSRQVQLSSADEHQFKGYLAEPDQPAKGAIVVIQEIFGVNAHIREVCDGYAADGYRALAPALFDRVKPGIELGYGGSDMMQGVEIARGKLRVNETLLDIQAAIDYLNGDHKTGLVGYCFGGLMSWLASCELAGIECAVSYYGGGVSGELDRPAKVPVLFHFGRLDAHIPMTEVNAVAEACLDSDVHVYEADHGFNCNHRASFDAAAADLALSRSLEFFAAHLD